jgi:hypothetical protein
MKLYPALKWLKVNASPKYYEAISNEIENGWVDEMDLIFALEEIEKLKAEKLSEGAT